MIAHAQGRGAVIAALLLASLPVSADKSAQQWLMKINQAARQLNYDGTFVYQHGSQLEAMRIVHRVRAGAAQERLVSLNGSAREIVRNDKYVRCYLPDEKRVVVEHRVSKANRFPSLLPEQLDELVKSYDIGLGKRSRVAGRPAQIVLISPRDDYRYGYQLWADVDSGLLLKTDLVDKQGNVLEQFMFTQVQVGDRIPDSAVSPEMAEEGVDWWYEEVGEGDAPTPDGRWAAQQLPVGFKLSSRTSRTAPSRKKLTEHLVYSDGLAAVSVFIESAGRRGAAVMEGASRMGAVHAFGRRVGEHHVTVVGEVPQATVSLIGQSLAPIQP